MSNVLAFIFLFLAIFSFIALIIGLVKPQLVVRWGTNRTRKRAAATYIASTVVSLVLFVVFVVIATTPKEQTQVTQDTAAEPAQAPAQTEAPKQEEKVVVETPKQQMFKKIQSLIESKQAFDTGSYVKGDIPAGEYAFISFEGSGKYYSEEDQAGNIIDNENFDSFGYVYVNAAGNIQTKGALINVGAFGTLGVSGAKQIYEVLNDVQNYKDSGYYKVGLDIQPGRYVLQSYGQGYAAVMAGPVGKGDIIDNENFDGRYAVNVGNGQYLKVSRGTISQ